MKVAIIGAGINGLYLAWKLSEKGKKITVFEKKRKIGKETCSGLFSERILDFIPQSKNLIENEINSVLIHFPKKTLKVKFSKKFFVMSHFDLDNLTADLAKKSGAKILLSEKKEKKEVLESFDRVIGCDGANSLVRKWLNLPEQKFYLGIQGSVKKENNSNHLEVWPIKNSSLCHPDRGFVWKIPRGKETEWGIMANPKKAKNLFDEFLRKKEISLEKMNSALIPQSYPFFKNSLITLCGDAAGLTKPWSGGGVIWGLTAADLLLKNFPDFLKYEKELKRFFSPKIFFSKIAVKLVYFFGFNAPWLMPKKTTVESDFLL